VQQKVFRGIREFAAGQIVRARHVVREKEISLSSIGPSEGKSLSADPKPEP
jgi:hypothetical protein